MTNVNIIIRDAETNSGETFSGLEERGIDAVQLNLSECIIIEKMTSGGRTGIVLLMMDDAGKHYVTTTTADIVEYGILAAIKGTNARWNVAPRP